LQAPPGLLRNPNEPAAALRLVTGVAAGRGLSLAWVGSLAPTQPTGSQAASSEIVAALHAGIYLEPTKQTLRDFTKDWLAAIEPTIRPSTHYSYGRNLRLHILPQLGSVQLRRIDAGMLNGLYAALLWEAVEPVAAAFHPGVCAMSTPSFTEHSGMRCAGDGSPATRPTWPAADQVP